MEAQKLYTLVKKRSIFRTSLSAFRISCDTSVSLPFESKIYDCYQVIVQVRFRYSVLLFLLFVCLFDSSRFFV